MKKCVMARDPQFYFPGLLLLLHKWRRAKGARGPCPFCQPEISTFDSIHFVLGESSFLSSFRSFSNVVYFLEMPVLGFIITIQILADVSDEHHEARQFINRVSTESYKVLLSLIRRFKKIRRLIKSYFSSKSLIKSYFFRK